MTSPSSSAAASASAAVVAAAAAPAPAPAGDSFWSAYPSLSGLCVSPAGSLSSRPSVYLCEHPRVTNKARDRFRQIQAIITEKGKKSITATNNIIKQAKKAREQALQSMAAMTTAAAPTAASSSSAAPSASAPPPPAPAPNHGGAGPVVGASPVEGCSIRTVLIVGGGPVGLVSCLLLFRLGFRVLLLQESRHAGVAYERKQIIQIADSIKLITSIIGAATWHQLESQSEGSKDQLVKNGTICIADLEYLLSVLIDDIARASEGFLRVYYGFKFVTAQQLLERQWEAQRHRSIVELLSPHGQPPAGGPLAEQTHEQHQREQRERENRMREFDDGWHRRSSIQDQEGPEHVPHRRRQSSLELSRHASGVATGSGVAPTPRSPPLLCKSGDELLVIDADIVIGADGANSIVRELAGIHEIAVAKNSVYAAITLFSNSQFQQQDIIQEYKPEQQWVREKTTQLATIYPHLHPSSPLPTFTSLLCAAANSALDERFERPKSADHIFQQLLETPAGFYFAEEISPEEYEEWRILGRQVRGRRKQHQWCVDRAKKTMKSWVVWPPLVDADADANGKKVEREPVHRANTQEEIHFDPAVLEAAVCEQSRVLDISLKRTDKFAERVLVDGKSVYVFLVGDSAHTTHFLTGSGFNQGCIDAQEVVKVLQKFVAKAPADQHQHNEIHLPTNPSDTQAAASTAADSQAALANDGHTAAAAAASTSSSSIPPPPAPSSFVRGPLVKQFTVSSAISEYDATQSKAITDYQSSVVKKTAEHAKQAFKEIGAPSPHADHIRAGNVKSNAAMFQQKISEVSEEQKAMNEHLHHARTSLSHSDSSHNSSRPSISSSSSSSDSVARALAAEAGSASTSSSSSIVPVVCCTGLHARFAYFQSLVEAVKPPPINNRAISTHSDRTASISAAATLTGASAASSTASGSSSSQTQPTAAHAHVHVNTDDGVDADSSVIITERVNVNVVAPLPSTPAGSAAAAGAVAGGGLVHGSARRDMSIYDILRMHR